MGRSGSHGGGGRSGGGRSGGSRSSAGRSARSSSSFSGSSSRSFSSNSGRSAMGGSSFGSSAGSRPTFDRSPSGRPATGRPTGSGYTSHRPTNRPGYRPTPRTVIHMGGGGLFSGGNYTYNTAPINNSTVYSEPPQAGHAAPKRKGPGCLVSAIIIIVIMLMLPALFTGISGGSSGADDITKSTVNRQKLHLNLSDSAGYYTDECGWIRNSTTLTNGLKEFYEDTGILPYVYIIDNIDGDYDPSTEQLEQFAEEQYSALFNDEGHALLVFWDYGGAYEYTLWLGEDTLDVMDNEACDILFDYLDYYYYYAYTDEEFFADAFSEAGERMMSVTHSPLFYITGIVLVAALIYLVYYLVKKNKEKEAERKRRAEEILNSPLEKFGENGDIIDELEKKYEKEI